MADQLGSTWIVDCDYCGRILHGDYSTTLKKRLAESIARFRAFNDAGNPAIPYIAAWREDEKVIWYEFVGRRLTDLLDCEPADIAEAFGNSIIDRCVYRHTEDAGVKKEIISRQELSRVRKWLREESKKNGIIEAVYKLALKDGKVVWLKDQAAIEVHEQDRICLSMGGLSIVSEEMEVEGANRLTGEQSAELKKTNEQLRREIAAHHHSEETMRAYIVELEQSNRDLQEFAYIASHDLQEPLSLIHALGTRLRNRHGDTLTEHGREYLRRIENTAARMKKLIKGLLRYSQLTTDTQRFEAVDLAAVLTGVLADMEIRLKQNGGRVEIGEMHTVEADPLQMRQLLQNLISNALTYCHPDREPLVRISGQQLTDENSRPTHCLISVQDNGIGFDEKYRERIFGIFQRLHRRTTYDGTGIGLATCKRIIERHGGDITAKSTPGQGAEFIVTLPLKQTHRLNPPPADLTRR